MADSRKTRVPLAERAEAAAASACPHCGYRSVDRRFGSGVWSCPNCGESGVLSWEPGTRPRDTATPDPWEPR